MWYYVQVDRLCGLVLRVPGYRFQRCGFDSRRYQIFWEVAGLELAPLSLVSTIEELLGRKSSGRWDPSRWPRGTLYPQKSGTNFAEKRLSLGRYSGLRPRGLCAGEIMALNTAHLRSWLLCTKNIFATRIRWQLGNLNCTSLLHLPRQIIAAPIGPCCMQFHIVSWRDIA
jgi:hypothetical protein